MEFASFEEALKICLSSPDGSFEQEAALAHCLQTAPSDLRAIITKQLKSVAESDNPGEEHPHSCGCGCIGQQD